MPLSKVSLNRRTGILLAWDWQVVFKRHVVPEGWFFMDGSLAVEGRLVVDESFVSEVVVVEELVKLQDRFFR